MAEHGGHIEHAPTPTPKSGSGGGGIGEAFGKALMETIDGVFAIPIAQVGLDTVEGMREVVQAASNLGAQSAKGGGKKAH